MSRQINQAGLDLIKSFESCKLTVYKDAGGKNTVGWGHLVTPDDGLEYGDSISQSEADDLLQSDLTVWQDFVSNHVEVPLTDNQFAALVSLCYNVGIFPLNGGDLGKLLNDGEYSDSALHILRYNEVNGVPSVGLTRRRKAEYALFMQS